MKKQLLLTTFLLLFFNSFSQELTIEIDHIINPACYNLQEGEVQFTSTGGTPPYSYNLINGSGVTISSGSNPIFSELTSGFYSIQVIDSTNETASIEFTIEEPSFLEVEIINYDVTCEGTNDGGINITATGGTPPYSYSLDLNNYQTENTFTNLATGTYTVQTVDANGCIYSQRINIKKSILNARIKTDNITCNGNNDGQINIIDPRGGTSPYSYSLNGGDFQTENTFTNLAPGTYTIEVQDLNACTYLNEVSISEPNSLNSTTTTNNIICSTSNDGEINITTTGGTPPYSYSLNGNDFQTENTFTNLAPGTYTVQTVDANACTYLNEISIVKPSFLEAEIISYDVTCNGNNDGGINITATRGTPPYSYSLNGNDFQTENAFTNLAAGNYTVQTVDANGCIVFESINIKESPSLNATINTNNITCNGSNDGQINIIATGGIPPYSYSLNGGDSQNDNVFANLAAGTYTIEVQDLNACTYLNEVSIVEPTSLNSTTTTNNIICSTSNDGEINITTTGGTPPYSYSLNGNNFQTENTFTNLAPGTYTVQTVDANACTYLNEISIVEPPFLEAEIINYDVTCNGNNDGGINVTATGGTPPYLYALDQNDFQTENTFPNLAVGTYTVQIIDANGCIYSERISIKESLSLNATTTITSNITCNGSNDGEINITATDGTPPYSYSLNGGDFQNDNVFTNLAAGTYTIEVQDANACINSIITTIDQPDVLTISSVDVTPSGNEPSGKISIETIGGTPPYMYSIDGNNFTSSNEFLDLTSGTYTITVQDTNGCSTNLSVTLNQVDIDNSINQVSDQLEVTYKNATSYQWINVDTKTRVTGATSSSFKPSESGNYQAEMTILVATTRTASNKKTIINNRKASQIILSPVIAFNINTLSTEDIEENNFKVYPNPTVNFINLPSKFLGDDYIIYTILGKEVDKGKITSTKLTVKSLYEGIYFLKIKEYAPLKFIKK